MLEHAQDIEALDIDDVEATAHPYELRNVFRPDEVRPTLDRPTRSCRRPPPPRSRFRAAILGEEPGGRTAQPARAPASRGRWGRGAPRRWEEPSATGIASGSGVGRRRGAPRPHRRGDGDIHAFNLVTCEEARTAVAEVDRRWRPARTPARWLVCPSPLGDGTRGIPTTCSSRSWMAGGCPTTPRSSSGSRPPGPMVGKTNLDEFAMDRRPRTPRSNSPATPSTSSGCLEAPRAARQRSPPGLRPARLRFGHRRVDPPTGCACAGWWGQAHLRAVSRYGLVASAPSLDQIGPFTTTVADAALALEVIGGHDPMDTTSIPGARPVARGGARPRRRACASSTSSSPATASTATCSTACRRPHGRPGEGGGHGRRGVGAGRDLRPLRLLPHRPRRGVEQPGATTGSATASGSTARPPATSTTAPAPPASVPR